MPKEGEITCTISVPRTEGGWTERAIATPFALKKGAFKTKVKTAGTFDCESHAEMRALSCVDDAERKNVLMVQNAFPCEKCHPALLKMSTEGARITIEVTANKGSYNLVHRISGLTVTEDALTIVYEAGHAFYDGTRDDFQIHAPA